MVLHRVPTRHVHLCSEDFDRQHDTVTSPVRTYRMIAVTRSQIHWYKGRGEDRVVIQTRCLCTDVRVDIWTFVRTHETHENPPAKSLHRDSPCVSANLFSQPLNHMTGLGVLECLCTRRCLTPCDPKTFYSNSWLSHTLYDHRCFFPPTPVDISHSENQLKEHQFFLIWYTMSCTTWSVVLLTCIH